MAKFARNSEAGLPLPSTQSLPKEKKKGMPPSFLKRGKKMGRQGMRGNGRARMQARAMQSDSDADD